MSKIEVHIADDHPTVVEGFKALMKAHNISVSGTSYNGEQTIKWFKDQSADVLILDISMPKKNGFEVLRFLKNKNQKTIIVSGYLTDHFVRESLQLGALGYVSKRDTASCIIEAIYSVIRGEQYLSKEVIDTTANSIELRLDNEQELEQELAHLGLSTKEIEVFKLVARNYSSDEIADELDVTGNTIRTYFKRIRDKLKIKKMIGVVRYVYEQGYYKK
jgi:DNA-binding NarL/FixJ family response regulator